MDGRTNEFGLVRSPGSSGGNVMERAEQTQKPIPDNTYEDGSVLGSVSASEGRTKTRGVITSHPKMVRTSIDRLTPLPNRCKRWLGPTQLLTWHSSTSRRDGLSSKDIDSSEIVTDSDAVTERK